MNSLISIKVIFCTLLINPDFSLKVQRTHYVEDGCNVGEDWKKEKRITSNKMVGSFTMDSLLEDLEG